METAVVTAEKNGGGLCVLGGNRKRFKLAFAWDGFASFHPRPRSLLVNHTRQQIVNDLANGHFGCKFAQKTRMRS